MVPNYETEGAVYMKTKEEEVYIRPLGDSALVIQLGTVISPTLHNKIINLVYIIELESFKGLSEVVPGYNNVTVFYDPVIIRLSNKNNKEKTAFEIVSTFIMNNVKKLENTPAVKKRLVEIPVLYGGYCGPDLEYIAQFNGITKEEVIELHTRKDYLVYMIGFAPGFPYLGDVDKQIATPRKEKPSPKIAAGSVGIAGEQTGIYSLDSPGGWQVIGQTPVDLFNPKSSPPTLLESGDEIRFISITKEEYQSYKEKNNDS